MSDRLKPVLSNYYRIWMMKRGLGKGIHIRGAGCAWGPALLICAVLSSQYPPRSSRERSNLAQAIIAVSLGPDCVRWCRASRIILLQARSPAVTCFCIGFPRIVVRMILRIPFVRCTVFMVFPPFQFVFGCSVLSLNPILQKRCCVFLAS